MTSEYDELLARLEDARRRIPKIGGAGAIYETELLEVIGAAIDGHRALISEVVERDAVIEQAPHGLYCQSRYGNDAIYEDGKVVAFTPSRNCTCRKAQAPRDALAARDAVRDKTVRATAIREAAEWLDENADRGHVPGNAFDENDRGQNIPTWLRARADQEEQ